MPTDLRARKLRAIDKAQLALALAGKVDYVYGYSFILTNLDVSSWCSPVTPTNRPNGGNNNRDCTWSVPDDSLVGPWDISSA